MKKIIWIAVLTVVFVLSKTIFYEACLKMPMNQMGQVMGLGALVVGYFVSKTVVKNFSK